MTTETMASASPVNRIVIVGGGTAGWMAAASLAHYFAERDASITLVESEQIGTVGVGEATIPGIRAFNAALGIDEIDFIQKTNASFKLGIEFNNWRELGTRFFHPFADYGMPLKGVEFQHYVARLRAAGETVDIADYSFAIALAQRGNFAQPHENPPTPLADFAYAYHFDAGLYANYLRRYAEQKGVRRMEGKITHTRLNETSGFIESVELDNGTAIEGQLFIDCSGFRGLLIEQALHTGYEDWRQWLPCDRAVAVQSELAGDPTPYTRTTAHEAGWQWRIPLQHRIGNGYVYASQFTTDEIAEQTLLRHLDGEPIKIPRRFEFVSGMRKQIWHKNCFALGLASGFLEPLESTSISLIQTGLTKLLQFFPDSRFDEHDRNEVNRLHRHEMERIRDFLILHYKATSRTDSAFWRHCQAMTVPDSLAHKMAIYANRGHVVMYEPEAFEKESWITMYEGFNKLAQGYDIRADAMPLNELKQQLAAMRQAIAQAAASAVSHGEFIRRHCRAEMPY